MRETRCRSHHKLTISIPLSFFCAVARPRAVGSRQEGLQGAQFPSWLVLQCGPLDCTRRSTNDLLGRHTASSGRADRACAAARSGRARRAPAPRGRRGASFFYADREHCRARRARWAARIPPTPSPRHLLPRTTHHLAAHHPAHRRSIGRPSPLSRRHRAAPSRPACRPAPPRGTSSPRLLRPGGRGALEGVALRRWDRPSAPAALARGPLELDPPRLDSAWAPFAFGSVGPARVRALRADLSFVCPHSVKLCVDDTVDEPDAFGAQSGRVRVRLLKSLSVSIP